jgi:hypothetical protein
MGPYHLPHRAREKNLEPPIEGEGKELRAPIEGNGERTSRRLPLPRGGEDFLGAHPSKRGTKAAVLFGEFWVSLVFRPSRGSEDYGADERGGGTDGWLDGADCETISKGSCNAPGFGPTGAPRITPTRAPPRSQTL